MISTEQILEKIKTAQGRLSNHDCDYKSEFVIEDVCSANGHTYSIVMHHPVRIDSFIDARDSCKDGKFIFDNMVLSIRLDWISYETAALMIKNAVKECLQ